MQEETHTSAKSCPTALNIIAFLACLATLGPAGHRGNNHSFCAASALPRIKHVNSTM